MSTLSDLRLCLFLSGAVFLVPACGGGGDGGTPPPTTTIAKTSTNSGDAQSGTVGQALALPLQVVVTETGTPSAGVTVNWSTTVAGGSLTPPAATTDVNGLASTSWTLGNTSGSQSARATLSGASGSPVTFTATAAPGAATSFAKVSGDGQAGTVGSQLADLLVAKASDQFGNGVPDVDVTWSTTAGILSATDVPTDATGASGVNLTLPVTVGPITITATAGTLPGSPLTFTATAAAPGPAPAAVSVMNNSFSPAALTIAAGTKVVWTWGAGAFQHNVVPVGTQPTRSGGLVNAPHTYEFTFNTPGTYTYFCELHGSPTGGMRGTIVVQ